MDGFKVVRIDEVVTQIDILITATGKLEYYHKLMQPQQNYFVSN